jgi:hypothetical protein
MCGQEALARAAWSLPVADRHSRGCCPRQGGYEDAYVSSANRLVCPVYPPPLISLTTGGQLALATVFYTISLPRAAIDPGCRALWRKLELNVLSNEGTQYSLDIVTNWCSSSLLKIPHGTQGNPCPLGQIGLGPIKPPPRRAALLWR